MDGLVDIESVAVGTFNGVHAFKNTCNLVKLSRIGLKIYLLSSDFEQPTWF